ncbi:hypothetical protein KR018_007360 [Drosophila ironensis]|nr:hypothetical protein KR018_007360 [Drosophila ironensis]
MYGRGVKVGNWYEFSLLEECRLSDMKKKRESGKLLMDRARAIYERFYQETVLGPPQEELTFGVVVQLKPIEIRVCRQPVVDLNLALSVVATQPSLVRKYKTINELCDLAVAPAPHPCIRNSFRIVSPDEEDRSGQLLTYGEKFRLQAMEPVDEPMYVYSGPKRINLDLPMEKAFSTSKHGDTNLPLGLISHKNIGPSSYVPTSHTHFFCAHQDPDMRYESEGNTMQANQPLLIVHAVTNRNLAVENTMAYTLFGPELQTSVQTYNNVHKRATWKNLWQFSY